MKIKSFLIILCFIIFGIGALILRFFILIFPEKLIKNQKKKLRVCSAILKKFWFVFIKIAEFLQIIKINIKEIEKIKTIKNSVIVSTHPSYIDVVILLAYIPYTTCFVAERLSKNIFFKGIINLLFILDTKNIEELEKSAIEMSNNGFNILIFPMGERHKNNEQPKIRKGASFIAQKTKNNISILKIETSYNFLMKNQPVYKIKSTPVIFNISYLDKINTIEMLSKYSDEAIFRKEVTNKIKSVLYNEIS